MTRKALLIGAQTHGLAGVLNDVDAMEQALTPRGFDVQRLVTPYATRAGIRDAYEKLTADAGTDDAVVVYYSGHGGRLRSPDGRDLQFIVPDDYADSDEDDFRGITDVELSVLLAGLTDRTHNVTVIFDCCHAAHMSRQPERRVKALLRDARARWRPTYESVERQVQRLVAEGLPIDRRPLIGNPHAVRVVACSPSGSSWESVNRDGVEMGLLTDALSRALRETDGLRISWAALVDAVRREVQTFVAAQRPEVEGPSGRQLFETTEADALDALPVAVDGPDRIRLLGAPLLGVRTGDEFAIMRGDATSSQDGPAMGTAVVTHLLPAAAAARLRLTAPGQAVPSDARAYRISAAPPALAVRLPSDHPVTAELAESIVLHPMLRLAAQDVETSGEVTVEVTVDEQGRLAVRDEAGPLHLPYRPSPAGVGAVVANLRRIAQATALRRLSGDPSRPLRQSVRTEWGRVRDGRETPLAPSGELLFAQADERIFFRVTNEGDLDVFVSLVDIGVSYRIALLTHSDPSGVRLEPGASYTYGWNEDRNELTGVAVSWPDGIDMSATRPETVLVLVSDGPVDVSSLQRPGVRGDGRRATGSGLTHLLAQIATGATREVGPEPAGQVRYAVQPIDFMLSPTPPPTAERAVFLVDERPAQPIRLLSPRGTAPGKLAVRIAELVVHRNRALGSADIRVDAVVLTGGSGGQPIYRAETMRFSNVRDGDRLPLDDVLIYHGPAEDFLDIAVWVSRDTTGSLALSALLEKKLTDPVVHGAVAEVAGLAMTAPHAAVAVALMGAGAVLVNTAYELLTGVVGQSVGLYRTSLLAQEQFGIGRHVRHPQDFSFTFCVDEVA
ncbi:caspase family protein [Micromonospora sp. WMMA1976]|uniref:caspase family protein n=1 Tax=Micromonospora sp. WMMA1976 TaxID=3014995 RepID=UPI00248D2380|nr:caspase family protein [Micromonospora sp. WMMA1976]WBC03311.1 caspase family protein [Micromonospora sp. WMMA1976]